HARENARIGEARHQADIDAAQSAVRGAEERVARLESDREALAVRAPADGLLTPIDLGPGDLVQARQVVARVLDPTHLVVRFDAPASAVDLWKPGAKAVVTPADL